ncbi:MAG: VWA domain-containing protein [Phycisphaeraceae bacterium]|nr:VWA domain-containing protein [Phycisphaeraceae bacterium]
MADGSDPTSIGPPQEANAGDRSASAWLWLRRATLAGIAISFGIHLFMWLLAGLIMVFTYSNSRPGGLPAGEVEFAVMTDQEFAKIQAQELPEQAPVVPDATTDTAQPTLDLLDTSLMADLSSISLDLDSIGSSAGAGDVGAISRLATGVSGSGTSFFGVEAEGSRIVYIVDVSGSMSVAGKWNRTRQELIASIEELLEGASFLVILFSSDAALLENRRTWSEAIDRNKKWVRAVLSRIEPGGATVPMPAFLIAFSTRPRPDAIFFMTDGQFDEAVVAELQKMNMEMQIPIHCITFGDRSAERQMRQIAQDSGGTYTHVEVSGP